MSDLAPDTTVAAAAVDSPATPDLPPTTDTLQDLLRSATAAPVWVGPFTLASHLTEELLGQIQAAWTTLDIQARILCSDLSSALSELMQLAVADKDDWVCMLGQLFSRVPETGTIDCHKVDELAVARTPLAAAQKQLAEKGVRFRRDEDAYLHQRLRMSYAGTAGVSAVTAADGGEQGEVAPDDMSSNASSRDTQQPLAQVRSSEGVTTRAERERRFSITWYGWHGATAVIRQLGSWCWLVYATTRYCARSSGASQADTVVSTHRRAATTPHQHFSTCLPLASPSSATPGGKETRMQLMDFEEATALMRTAADEKNKQLQGKWHKQDDVNSYVLMKHAKRSYVLRSDGRRRSFGGSRKWNRSGNVNKSAKRNRVAKQREREEREARLRKADERLVEEIRQRQEEENYQQEEAERLRRRELEQDRIQPSTFASSGAVELREQGMDATARHASPHLAQRASEAPNYSDATLDEPHADSLLEDRALEAPASAVAPMQRQPSLPPPSRSRPQSQPQSPAVLAMPPPMETNVMPAKQLPMPEHRQQPTPPAQPSAPANAKTPPNSSS
ncbi:hypothetical protein THASP1DRAFT_26626, partial [Thamnocephalis sphaerospora]